MADTKISALTAASAALGADELAINEAGTSKKLTVTQIQALINAVSPASAGGGSAGTQVWVGTTDPAGSASEGDIWVDA